MSFCLNCGNHKTCDCAGPPPEARTNSEDSAGACEHGIHKGKDGYYYYRSEEDGTEWWIHPNVMESVKDSFGEPVRILSEPMKVTQQPEVPKDLRHPATKWFDQQVEEVLIPDGHIDPSGYPIGIDGEFFKHLMTKAFNAGACHACREILDVIPRGPLNDCCKDEFQFAIEDIDAICGEWLG